MLKEILHREHKTHEEKMIEPVLIDIDDTKFSGAVIVTESAADLLPEQIEKYQLNVAPMHVNMGSKDMVDWSFHPGDIFEYYDEHKQTPTTSAVSPGDYHEMFTKLREQYPDKYILHLCYSAITTATWKSAVVGSDDCPGIIHIDTRQVSAGLGMIVCEAAKWLQANPKADSKEIIEHSQKIIDKVHFAFVPSDLLYLKAGGRLSNAQFAGATILGIKPVIELVDGKLVCTKKIRGKMQKVCIQLIDSLLSKYETDKNNITLLYTDGFDSEIRKAIESHVKELGYKNPTWAVAGGVISCHGGPAAFGFSFCEIM